MRALKVKQVGNVFAPWLPGKSGLDKALMKEDKLPTKALYLNTGDKKKSKYSPQKIHSSIEFGSKQFKSRLMWRDRVSLTAHQ